MVISEQQMRIRNYIKSVRKAASYIKKRSGGVKPDVVVILGSGLAGASPDLKGKKLISYKDIPEFPQPTVSGHSGRLLIGRCPSGKKRNVSCRLLP